MVNIYKAELFQRCLVSKPGKPVGEEFMSEVIASFEKNSFEEVRISLTKYKGKDLVDLRVYYRPNDGEEMLPTKKGITISPEKFPELKKAVLALEKALQKIEKPKDQQK